MICPLTQPFQSMDKESSRPSTSWNVFFTIPMLSGVTLFMYVHGNREDWINVTGIASTLANTQK